MTQLPDIIYEQSERFSNQTSTIHQDQYEKKFINNKSEFLYASVPYITSQPITNDIRTQIIQNSAIPKSKSLLFFTDRSGEDDTSFRLNSIGNKLIEHLVTCNTNDSNDGILLKIASPITAKTNIIDINPNNKKRDKQSINTIIYNQSLQSSNEKPKVDYRELDNYYFSLYLSSNTKIEITQSNHQGKLACLYQFLYAFNPKYKLIDELISDRDYIIFLNRFVFNPFDDFHINILYTIYNSLINNNTHRKPFDNSITQIDEVSSWLSLDKEKPISVLSLSKAIELIDKHFSFISHNLTKFINKDTGINYLLVVIAGITEITIEIIENGKLTSFFNQNKSVLLITMQFLYGLLEKAMIAINALNKSNNILEINKISIEAILTQLRTDAYEAPSSILWQYNSFIQKYPSEFDSLSIRNSISKDY